MASMLKIGARHKHEKPRNKFRLPISAWLSYLFIATLILSSISLARFTATSSDSDSVRVANFSVSATMKDTQKNEIISANGGECRFEVKNNSEIAVIYKAIIKGLPNGVNATLSVGKEVIQMTSETDNSGVLVSGGKVLEADKADICTLSFTAPEEITGTHNVSVQVQFDQID